MRTPWEGVRRLLCVRLDSLGDVLMCTPAMRALKEGLPGSHLTLLGSTAGVQLAPFVPEIDAVISFSAPWMKHSQDAPRSGDGDAGRSGGEDRKRVDERDTEKRVDERDMEAGNDLRTDRAKGAGKDRVNDVKIDRTGDVKMLPVEHTDMNRVGEESTGRVADENDEASPDFFQCVAMLRRRAFDAAVIFASCSQSPLPAALLCQQAGIPLRLAICRENPYALLTDWVPETEADHANRHEVRRQLDLVAALGCMTADTRLSFQAPDDAVMAVTKLLAEAGIDPVLPLVVLHPGASAPSRRYPARHWPPLMRRLARSTRCQLILTGTASEADAIDAMLAAAAVPALSLAGKLGLGELGALLSRAALLVANNTGPAHIAAALGTPVLSLYAMTNPQHTPWRVAQKVLFHPVPCKNCLRSACPEGHHACLEFLAPETAALAAAELLDTGLLRPAYAGESHLAFS